MESSANDLYFINKDLFVIKERKVGYPIIVYSQVIPSCLSLSSLLFFPTFEIRLLILKKKIHIY